MKEENKNQRGNKPRVAVITLIVILIAVLLVFLYYFVISLNYLYPAKECKSNYFTDSQLGEMNKTLAEVDYYCSLSVTEESCGKKVFRVYSDESGENVSWAYVAQGVDYVPVEMNYAGDQTKICIWSS